MSDDTVATTLKPCLEMVLDDQTVEIYRELIRDYAHDVRGRVASIKLELYLLERKLGADTSVLFARLKAEVEDLIAQLESLNHRSKPCRSSSQRTADAL